MRIKKDDSQKHRINFRLTEGQYLVIKLKARYVGFCISEYLREAALNKKLISHTDKAMLVQMRWVGVNLNNLTRSLQKLSRNDKIDTHLKEISEVETELRKLFDELNQKIKNDHN